MRHLDPALGKVTGRTKILPVTLAGDANTVRTGSADRGDHEAARFEVRRARAGFDHFPQGFVTEHQILRAFGRASILEIADLAIRPANADFDRPDDDLIWGDRKSTRL